MTGQLQGPATSQAACSDSLGCRSASPCPAGACLHDVQRAQAQVAGAEASSRARTGSPHQVAPDVPEAARAQVPIFTLCPRLSAGPASRRCAGRASRIRSGFRLHPGRAGQMGHMAAVAGRLHRLQCRELAEHGRMQAPSQCMGQAWAWAGPAALLLAGWSSTVRMQGLRLFARVGPCMCRLAGMLLRRPQPPVKRQAAPPASPLLCRRVHARSTACRPQALQVARRPPRHTHVCAAQPTRSAGSDWSVTTLAGHLGCTLCVPGQLHACEPKPCTAGSRARTPGGTGPCCGGAPGP